MNRSINFRQATPEDIEQVFNIENTSSRLWKRDYFLNELDTEFSYFIVAQIEDEIVGFAIIWDVVDGIQINNIAVKQNRRRTGVGKAMINHVINFFKGKDHERIFLEVKENNLTAQSFYQSQGFYKTGKRKNYYIDSDAILMEKAI